MLRLLTGTYSLARRSGLLDTTAGGDLFTAAYFQYKKRFEDPFDGLVRRHPQLFRGGHIVDAGANIGYCTALFSRAADAGRRVFAFEPEAFNMRLLERVIRRQGLGNVTATQAALGDRDGEIRMKLNRHHHGDHRVMAAGEDEAGSVTVPAAALDTFLEKHGAATPVRFIKIDVQGYEPAVCRGAERTLECNPECAVALEYMPEALAALGFRPAELPAWFAARGWRAHVLHKDGSVTPGMPAELGPRGYADLLFSREPVG